MTLSSPPVAGVGERTGAVVLWQPSHHPRDAHTGVVEERSPPPPPHMIVKRFWCTTIHNKSLYKCIIHSFITSEFSNCFDFDFSICFKLLQNNVKTQKITFFILVDINIITHTTFRIFISFKFKGRYLLCGESCKTRLGCGFKYLFMINNMTNTSRFLIIYSFPVSFLNKIKYLDRKLHCF